MQQLLIQFINYVWWLVHVSALLHCHLQGAFLVPSEECLIEEQSREYLDGRAQFGVSQKALGALPADSNVMPKHVGATRHN
jgi:hypothetical protein